MNQIFEDILAPLKPVKLAYCDYLADRIHRALAGCDRELIIREVGRVQSDLDPVGGWFVSTKKTIAVEGTNGLKYRITVEECE